MKIRIITLLLLLFCAGLSLAQTEKAGFHTREIFKTQEARQGVAVDANYFYTVNSTGIGKYSKTTGSLVI